MKVYHDQQFATAGLPHVTAASDLTADHVDFLGAMHRIAGYHIIPGQVIPLLTRRIHQLQWQVRTNAASKKYGSGAPMPQGH